MAKRMTFPRNEASRADLISGPTRVYPGARNDLGRQEMIRSSAYGNPNVSLSLSGTVTALATGTVENVTAGGQTLIITVSGDEFVDGIGLDNDVTAEIIAGITGPGSEAAGWNAQILAGDGTLDYTDVSATSTIITITLPASASFALVANEVVTALLPTIAFRNGERPVGPFNFTVSAAVMTLTGTAISGGVLESEIVTGSETVIMTLTGGQTWAATLGSDNALTTAFLADIVGDLADAAGWNAQMALVHGDLARTSSTIMTLTLPATAGYSITSDDETVTIDLTEDGIFGGFGGANTKTFVITEGS